MADGLDKKRKDVGQDQMEEDDNFKLTRHKSATKTCSSSCTLKERKRKEAGKDQEVACSKEVP